MNQFPINKVEDVEFSIDQADQEDLITLERSQKADRRQGT
ncbi:MAG TPA: YfhD family protein [Candidatus Paenibacillus intestinavium]|nr:YfhD family protein [Candidatus Paenibacillus intestinavium]